MTIADLLKKGVVFLEENKIDDARSSARFLLCYILRVAPTELSLQLTDTVTQKQIDLFQNTLERRALHEPVDYIIGSRPFHGLLLEVTNQTLIPRSETEQLVSYVAEYCRENNLQSPTIFDAGTGSGAIALSLAHLLGDTKPTVLGFDISAETIAIAKRNATRLNLANLHFFQSDLLDTTNKLPGPTIIVANLPYVPSTRIQMLELEVRNFEPRLALDGGVDGLDLYRQLFSQIDRLRLMPQALFLEIDETHGQLITELAISHWPQISIDIRQDLSGLDRFAIITFA